MEKDADAYRTISEVAATLDIPPHVLRFWETKFPQVKPLKRGGGRRYYRRPDTELLRTIRRLLYEDGYTIRGVQRLLKVRGPAAVAALEAGIAPVLQDGDEDAVMLDSPIAPGQIAMASPDEIKLALTGLLSDIRACRRILSEALEQA